MKRWKAISIILIILCLACLFTACMKEDASLKKVTGIDISDDCTSLVWDKVEGATKYYVYNDGEKVKTVKDTRISLDEFEQDINTINIRAIKGNKMSQQSEEYIFVKNGSDNITYGLTEDKRGYSAKYLGKEGEETSTYRVPSIYEGKKVVEVSYSNETDCCIPDTVEELRYSRWGDKRNDILRLPKNLKRGDEFYISITDNARGYRISEENEYYCTLDGVLYSKDMSTLILYPGNKTDESFKFPDEVTSIEEAFVSEHIKNIDFNNAVNWETKAFFFMILPNVKEFTIPHNVVISKDALCWLKMEEITIPKEAELPIGMLCCGVKNIKFERGRNELLTCIAIIDTGEGIETNIYIPDTIEKIIYDKQDNIAEGIANMNKEVPVNIYCEAEEKPEGWHDEWQTDCNVHWDYKMSN